MTDAKHSYYAEAKVLEGSLNLPVQLDITPQLHTQLSVNGGYQHIRSEGYQLEGVLSYGKSYSHAGGNPSDKKKGGHDTLVTSVITDLNIMEILTADRIVSQIILNHPQGARVPTVSFLGTRFENLRLAGEPLDLDWNLDFLGERPAGDKGYTTDPTVISRARVQYENILRTPNLPEDLQERYNQLVRDLGKPEQLEFSLVNQAHGAYPGQTYGNVIRLRHFGTVTLGKVVVKQWDWDAAGKPQHTNIYVTMIDLKMGCVGSGNIPIASGGSGSHVTGD